MKYRKNKSHETRKNNATLTDNVQDILYDIQPNIETQIEKLLKKHNINKYDYKITHFITDIIQKETLKILKNAKNIKKEYTKKLKESNFREKAEELNELLKSDWNEYKNENENENMLRENMGDIPIYDQDNRIHDSYSNDMYDVMNINQMQQMGTMENEVAGIDPNMEEVYNFGMYNEHGRTLPFIENSGAMNNEEFVFGNNKYIYENEKKQSFFHMENSMGNNGENTVGNYEEDIMQSGNTNNMEHTMEENVVGNNVVNAAENNLANMGENNLGNVGENNLGNVGENNLGNVGENNLINVAEIDVENMGENDVRNQGENHIGNIGEHVVSNAEGTVEGLNMDPFFDNNKENILLINIETEPDFNQLIGNENNFIYAQEKNTEIPYVTGVTKEDKNNSALNSGIGTTNITSLGKDINHKEEEKVDELLIIDEDSVTLAIKEYILQNINRKKSVDFLYEPTNLDENRKKNNYFVRRDIKYPTTLPPYLPDDCSVNTVLPPWDLCYIEKPFEEAKGNERKGENVGTGSGQGKTAGAEGFQKWNK